MKYTVTIEEVLIRTIEIEAETQEEALQDVHKAYNACEIILDSNDHFDTKIY